MYVLAAMLLGGLLCNLLIRPVADRHFMSEAQLAAERAMAHETAQAANGAHASFAGQNRAMVAVAWVAVGIPLAWGVWSTLVKALALFR
jgi:hypothetical protein